MGQGVLSLEKMDLKDLRLEWEPDDTFNIMRVIGRITNSNSFDLNHRIHRVFENGQYNVILDLSKLEFINSTGIAILYSLFSRARDNGGKIVIGGLHPFLRNIFGLMEMPAGMDVEETVEDARKHFSS